ncbi:PcfJ domain-containing protein [Lachnoclostridium phytofermentans]|uniref:PcfJ domain-containing protein n=1 Tax=Lachnoclostridium phytofermentans TaxID=66219 RepID=UPI000496E631|nr:PcfJ domain-containing protein [Lachnoclostridium phytofermentans]
MKIEELKKLRKLYATKEMMQKAGIDVPKRVSTGGYYKKLVESYKNGVYMRGQNLGGIFKIAFFLADRMRVGIKEPVYELFINYESGEFITYDVSLKSWRNAKLDMLEWPEYVYHSGKFVNAECNRSIKNLLKVTSGGFKGILDYQLNVRADQLKKKHKRETNPWDLDMDEVPELPKDWNKWVEKVGITSNYIFYEYQRNGAKTGYCSWCEKDVPIAKVKHNMIGKCKCCGHEVTFKSIGKTGNFYSPEEYMYLVQKCDDGFVIREFRGHRRYMKGSYKKPVENYASERRRTIYNEYYSSKNYYFGDYKNTEMRWIKGYERSNYYYSSYYGDYAGKVYGKTLPSLSKDILRKSGLYEMVKNMDKLDPETYINSLRGKPYLEQLAKAGLTRLAYQVMKGTFCLDNFHTSVGELSKALLIDKQRMKRLRENNGGNIYIKWLRDEKNRNKIVSDEVLKFFEAEKIEPDSISFIRDRMSEVKIANYLKKQYRLNGRKIIELISTWQDYLSMANRLKMDVKQELIYKPKDLIQSHNIVVSLCGDVEIAKRAAEIAEEFPNVDAICREVKEKYEFVDKKYAVIVPQKIEDIIYEGKILGHCLDRHDIYFDRIERKESFIMFLRKTEEIDKPYYTLEVEPKGTIRQKRTVGDKQNPDFKEAKKFLEKWQREIQKNMNMKDAELATESANLRVKEFEELRLKKVKIRGGHLAGKLLVEILEADLMEADVESREGEYIVA